jgi:hypothetical protein
LILAKILGLLSLLSSFVACLWNLARINNEFKNWDVSFTANSKCTYNKFTQTAKWL